MGRFGWHSGQVHALNIQTGSVDISTDGSGDGSGDVSFSNTMRSTPSITLTPKEEDSSGTYSVSGGGSNNGFTAYVRGSSITSDTVSVGWVAIDQTE